VKELGSWGAGEQGRQKRLLFALSAAVALVLVWSGIGPKDRFTWFLEVIPALIAWPLLAFTYRRFRFTTLTYTFIALHMAVLMVGGHYTYAEVPLFDWVRDVLHSARNDYDRVGHFMQGLVPALVAREVLLRASPLKRGRWLFFLVTCVCLAVSASYELFEWATAEATGSAADAFLGTQGDAWDTQWDMFTALLGALSALLLLAPWQDRQMKAQEMANGEPRMVNEKG
jgi:putative membrane protein